MRRLALSPGLLLLVSMAAALSIEQQVERKKQELLVHNPYARSNPSHLQEKVFCLCTRCTTEPLMHRNAMVASRTAYHHRKLDISKKLVSEGEINKANGSSTVVPYGDYFGMFRQFLVGAADENGFPCGFRNHTSKKGHSTAIPTSQQGRPWTVTSGSPNVQTLPTRQR